MHKGLAEGSSEWALGLAESRGSGETHKHSEMQDKDRGGGVRKPEFKSALGHSVICIMSQSVQTKNEEAGLGFV